jgi:peptide methionine sulfoxide reductase msrA/msrB
MIRRSLTPEEERVIVHKGTEPPFSGRYVSHHADGTYTCRRCGASLFRSKDKFESGCGWPSFDDAVEGAVATAPDPDGERVEITCAECGAHLGHVFEGEGFTPKDTRHCVNSVSLDFAPAARAEGCAYFAGGCFWGVEAAFEGLPGVKAVRSGYMGGRVANPSYEQVCTGTTGHAESVEIVFDPAAVTYETLARMFFEIHDPTQIGGQGPDIGEQYRSAVFYADEAQKRVALGLIARLREKGYGVVTQVVPAGAFYAAEEYHQDYYARHGGGASCHVRVRRF